MGVNAAFVVGPCPSAAFDPKRAVLSAPASIGAGLAFSDERWDPELVRAAVETKAGCARADPAQAGDAYSWIRAVEEWLQRFHDPAQRDVALAAGRREYGQEDRTALYAALARHAGDRIDLVGVRREHADRLVLTLAAEGFLEPSSSVLLDAAPRTCTRLSNSPPTTYQ